MSASLKSRPRRLPAAIPERATPRQAFPSKRQAAANGLEKRFYPAYLREFVDFDYAGKLGEAERVWLAAFTEEYYRGWGLKKETQVHPPELLRECNARHQNLVRRGGDTLSGEGRRGPSLDEPRVVDAYGSRGRHVIEEVLAASCGRNAVEEEMVRRLDRPRLVK